MTEKWVRDTGLVFALLALFLGLRGNKFFLGLCGALLLCILFVPKALTPLAFVWLKLAELLGKVMNKVFFGLVFIFFVVPMGGLKRLFGGDLRDLRKDSARKTAFVPARGLTTKVVFEKPY